jgi:hypothetical protein
MVTTTASEGTMCSRGCGSDLDCPNVVDVTQGIDAAGICLDPNGAGTICHQACELDTDCATGSECLEVVSGAFSDFVCLPTNLGPGTGGGGPTQETYDACSFGSDCIDGADQCLEVTTTGSSGAFCSRGCAFDTDCPTVLTGEIEAVGLCLDTNGGGLVCYQACEFDTDCATGSICLEILTDGFSDFACLPNNLN